MGFAWGPACGCRCSPATCSVAVCLQGCASNTLCNYDWVLYEVGTPDTEIDSGTNAATDPCGCVTLTGLTAGTEYKIAWTFNAPDSTFWQDGNQTFTIPDDVACNGTLTISVTPQSGYECGGCTICGGIAEPDGTCFTLTDPLGNDLSITVSSPACQTYTASYEKIIKYCQPSGTCKTLGNYTVPVKYFLTYGCTGYSITMRFPVTCRLFCGGGGGPSCATCTDYTPWPFTNPNCTGISCATLLGSGVDFNGPPFCPDYYSLIGDLPCTIHDSPPILPSCAPGTAAYDWVMGALVVTVPFDCDADNPFDINFSFSLASASCLCNNSGLSAYDASSMNPLTAIWPTFNFRIRPC